MPRGVVWPLGGLRTTLGFLKTRQSFLNASTRSLVSKEIKTDLLFGLFQWCAVEGDHHEWVYIHGFKRMHSAQARAEKLRGRAIWGWRAVGKSYGAEILEVPHEFRIKRDFYKVS